MRYHTYTGSINRATTISKSPFGSPRTVDPHRVSGLTTTYTIESGMSVGNCPCNSQEPQQQARVMEIKRYGDMNVLDPYYSPWGQYNNPCKGCYPYQYRPSCVPPMASNPCASRLSMTNGTNGTAQEYNGCNSCR